MSTAQWIKEAEEQAKKYSDAIKTSNQYLLDQLNASKTNTLEQLQKQQENALYNLNSQQSDINKTAEDNAKQANINRLLALKSNESAMNRAGLGTQGVVGSQVNSINNSYGTNLNKILSDKTSNINDLLKNKNDTNTTYDTNRLNFENEYGTNIANMQKSIDDSALNQYNSVYNTVLAMKQKEWENEQAIKAAEEAKRQWEAEYALAQQSARRSSNSSSNGSNKTTQTWDNTPSEDIIVSSKTSARLSSTNAGKWVDTNITRPSINSNGISISNLKSKLTTGYSSGILTADDIQKVLKTYGLS